MSVKMMTLVWQIELPDSEKIVLLALADAANDEGYCWPGMKSLARKCSKGERTVQGCIQSLEAKGHLTRNEEQGLRCTYFVHPRSACAPAENDETPAAAARHPRSRCGRTIKNHQEPSPQKRAIPDNWEPRDFGADSQSQKVINGWPPGERVAQVEQFKAHHRARGNKFLDPQDAWSTWVLNTRKFGVGRNERSNNPLFDAVNRIVANG